jgi:MoaA/NifB/PqqE/SkfB family radical SAM enzyme
VCRKGAYEKIIAAIENMVELDVPFRFNCTMSKPVVPILPEIARKAVHYGANAVNFIAFNPFEDQETGIRTHDNVARYSDIKPKLEEAMDILEEAGIECNVRYLPLCMAEERHRKNFYNFQQLPYDHHEWDYQSWMWTGLQPQRMKGGDLVPPFRLGPFADRVFRGIPELVRDNYKRRPVRGKVRFTGQHIMSRVAQTVLGKAWLYRNEAKKRARIELKYKYHEGCERCAMRDICDGFHGDYAELHGTAEATPIDPGKPRTQNPLYYIQNQQKVVEREDASWAL